MPAPKPKNEKMPEVEKQKYKIPFCSSATSKRCCLFWQYLEIWAQILHPQKSSSQGSITSEWGLAGEWLQPNLTFTSFTILGMLPCQSEPFLPVRDPKSSCLGKLFKQTVCWHVIGAVFSPLSCSSRSLSVHHRQLPRVAPLFSSGLLLGRHILVYTE